MSNFPKKGTRRLEVDGKVYLWRVNSYEPDWDLMEPYRTELLVQPEGEGGTVWTGSYRDSEGHPPITPAMVEDLIREERP